MNFGYLFQKWPFCDAYPLSKKGPETPIFIVFWGWALFGPRCQKREILKSHPKKKNLIDNWKAIFWGIFAVFGGGGLFFLFFFVFFVCFWCFLEGFKGFVFFCVFLFCFFVWFFVVFCCFLLFFVVFCCFLLFFLEGLRVRWGGPKGHLTWP